MAYAVGARRVSDCSGRAGRGPAHTHPQDPGPPGGTSEMMTVCDTVQAKVPKPYPPRPSNWLDGPNNDWQYMDVVNSSRLALHLPLVTGYVLDRRFLYRMEPNQLSAHPDSVVTRDISSNACRWP